MKRRYFSPDLKFNFHLNQERDKPSLRWMGSSGKLSASTGISEDIEERIGSYIFSRDREIGHGYSSKVYKGRKIGENLDYAIKVIELKKYTNSNIEMLKN